jgi:hypothetical protein
LRDLIHNIECTGARQGVLQIFKAGVLYFSLVFATGFVLGSIRVLWIIPILGVRWAELMELPVMLVVTVLAARWAARRVYLWPTPGVRLSVGLVALGLLLSAELIVVLSLRHSTIREYVVSRGPVAGTAYLVMLGAFAVMPLFVNGTCEEERTRNFTLLDQFIPKFDVRTRHQITIHAPAEMVFDTARDFDMESIFVIRAIFWLRSLVLGAKMQRARRSTGLVTEMLDLGWGRLAEEPNRFFVAGAACQPWQADVAFSPVPPDQFPTFAQGDRVKIAWSLETETLGPALTRFTAETRAVATDDAARTKFRRYWVIFGIGALMIRRLLLAALRQRAERRWQAARVFVQ